MENFKVYEFKVQRVWNQDLDQPIFQLSDPVAVAKVFANFTAGEARECFLTAFLDINNRCIGIEKVAIGTLTEVSVHPREVFRSAILAGAAGIVCGHNHPSGNCKPSNEDLELTRRLINAGELLGIPVCDHVVFSEQGAYYSIVGKYAGLF